MSHVLPLVYLFIYLRSELQTISELNFLTLFIAVDRQAYLTSKNALWVTVRVLMSNCQTIDSIM